MTMRTIGKRYWCLNPNCEKFHRPWIVPPQDDSAFQVCVCARRATFLGYIEEEILEDD